MSYFRDLLKNIDKGLIVLVLVFAGISVIMIGSAFYETSFVFTRQVKVQMLAYLLGFVAIAIILMIDYHLFEGLEKILYGLSILLLILVFVPVIGKQQYGSYGWLNFGILDFQPSEFVKISFVLIYARYLSKNKNSLDTYKGVFLAGAYALPFFGLILIEPDLGNAAVIFFIAIGMIFSAGIKGKIFAKLTLAAIAIMPIVYFFMEPHQKTRIDAFLNPQNLDLAGNYQIWNSKIAVGSGGFLGKGLFEGTQKKLGFLPVQESDFIFAVIAEELGFIGGVIIILLYFIFLFRLILIANSARDHYGSLIVIGFLSMFTFQVFENIGMTMGLMPVTGITMPFISYGGSSVLTNMIALGIILNVGIRRKTINF